MGEIASEARMSRPALYLVFPDKAEIFRATVRAYADEALTKVRAVVARDAAMGPTLKKIFGIWTVTPFREAQDLPDARELTNTSHEIAGEESARAYGELEDVLVELFSPRKEQLAGAGMTPRKLARTMTSAAHGFKERARTVKELTMLVATMVQMALTTLGAPEGDARSPTSRG